MAFLASAWISLFFVASAYVAGLIPSELLNDYDVLFVGCRSHASHGWTKALQKAVLVFSDQQIVFGIAVLVAGFLEWRQMSIYHWQMVI